MFYGDQDVWEEELKDRRCSDPPVLGSYAGARGPSLSSALILSSIILTWHSSPGRKAAAILGLHPQTLRNYAGQGKIPYCRQLSRTEAI